MVHLILTSSMTNSSQPKLYTRTTKWYNLAYLAYIALTSSTLVITTVLGTYEDSNVSDVGVVRSGAMAVVGIAAIVGISLDKAWARWAAIATYGCFIFVLIEGLVASLLANSALTMLLGSSTIIALRGLRIVMLILALVGVGLLMSKRSADPA